MSRQTSWRAPARRVVEVRALIGVLWALGLGGCADGPTGPSTIEPEPQQFSTYQGRAFLDLDGDGLRGDDERLRVPGVTVSVWERRGQTEAGTGRVTLSEVLNGPQTRTIEATPPFYVAEVPTASVTVPLGAVEQLALRLPIGDNRPATYMAFGDSITMGVGSPDDMGYRGMLARLLAPHFGGAEVIEDSWSGSQTPGGVERIAASLQREMPAYTLILYGTNDWHNLDCQRYQDCPVVDNLRTMVQAVKAAGSLPVLGTIIPANPALQPPSRNEWVARTNDDIRAMAEEEDALVADLHAAFVFFMGFTDVFSDHVHPNDVGYRLIAEQFFAAISGQTQPTPDVRAPWSDWAFPAGGSSTTALP